MVTVCPSRTYPGGVGGLALVGLPGTSLLLITARAEGARELVRIRPARQTLLTNDVQDRVERQEVLTARVVPAGGPYRPVEDSRDGTGLGLNIVKLITDKMDGAVWFETGVGAGTTFFVRFPLARVAAEA